MPPFRDEQILVRNTSSCKADPSFYKTNIDQSSQIIAPGSRTTLVQLGLPESLTPARFHLRSCMFPAEKKGEYEPNKVREKEKSATTNGHPSQDGNAEETEYEEDIISEEGSVWPIQAGKIVDWPCFFGLMDHVYRTINPPFHTAILLVAEPTWTPKEHERITQFFFEKYKMPAFGLMDAASATIYAYGLHTATVVDVGYTKADITAISEFLIHDTGRALSVPNCGGESMTEHLLKLLAGKNFTRDMCEQLKKSPLCEILPTDVELPSTNPSDHDAPANPAAIASTGVDTTGHPHALNGAVGEIPRGPGPGTEVGIEAKEGEDNDGVLDIASIVTGGNMSEFLERKEREKAEKAEKAAAKKKGADAAAAAAKPVRLSNSKRAKNTFIYEDHALHNAMKDMKANGQAMADMQAAMDTGDSKRPEQAGVDADPSATDAATSQEIPSHNGVIRREIEVGLERFQASTLR